MFSLICYLRMWHKNLKFSCHFVTFWAISICDSLSVTCYMWLNIWIFYLKLATTCKNLFLSLVVVRLVIFLFLLTAFIVKCTYFTKITCSPGYSWSVCHLACNLPHNISLRGGYFHSENWRQEFCNTAEYKSLPCKG